MITALSRNWSMFNSGGGLTGTSTKRHLTVLSETLAAWVAAAVAAVTNSFSQKPQNFDFINCGRTGLTPEGSVPELRRKTKKIAKTPLSQVFINESPLINLPACDTSFFRVFTHDKKHS